MKKQNSRLKTLLAIGGWNMGNNQFKAMASDNRNRAEFISSALDFLRKHNFDGLDLVWEYPAAADKPHFSALVQVRTRIKDCYIEVQSHFSDFLSLFDALI